MASTQLKQRRKPIPPSHLGSKMANEHTGQRQERDNGYSGENMFHNADLIHLTEQKCHDKACYHESHVAGIVAVQAENAAGNNDEL